MLNKKREIRYMTDRGSSKLRKLEGNVNITSNRLTIPPGYLTLGITSETFRKDTGKNIDCKGNDEDLQGFFSKYINVNSSVRRSERISKKNTALDAEQSFNFPRQFFNNFRDVESERTPAKSDRKIWRNRSKSLFREINEKYVAKVPPINSYNILTPPQENISFSSGPEEESPVYNSSFCKNLSKHLQNSPSQKILVSCKSRILSKISEINSVLAGKTQPKAKMGTHVQFSSNNLRNSSDPNFQYYPRSQWVYETPPRQKLIIPRLEECQLHPAVIYSTKKDTNIYEIASNVNIDLSTCATGRRVNFDKRFLSHVGTFQHDNNDIEKGSEKKTNQKQIYRGAMDYRCFPMESASQEKSFNFTKPNPFAGLISRPRKTIKASRVRNILKRKRDTPGGYEDCFEPTASGALGQNMFGNCFPLDGNDLRQTNFEFKKKLNFCDTENERGSDSDQQNLFDFSQQ